MWFFCFCFCFYLITVFSFNFPLFCYLSILLTRAHRIRLSPWRDRDSRGQLCPCPSHRTCRRKKGRLESRAGEQNDLREAAASCLILNPPDYLNGFRQLYSWPAFPLVFLYSFPCASYKAHSSDETSSSIIKGLCYPSAQPEAPARAAGRQGCETQLGFVWCRLTLFIRG